MKSTTPRTFTPERMSAYAWLTSSSAYRLVTSSSSLRRVLCRNSFAGASHGVPRSLSPSAVLVYQTAKDLPALDPGGDIDGLAELPPRRFLLQSLVRPMAVIVPGVLSRSRA
jgi:hypothetical protein